MKMTHTKINSLPGQDKELPSHSFMCTSFDGSVSWEEKTKFFYSSCPVMAQQIKQMRLGLLIVACANNKARILFGLMLFLPSQAFQSLFYFFFHKQD